DELTASSRIGGGVGIGATRSSRGAAGGGAGVGAGAASAAGVAVGARTGAFFLPHAAAKHTIVATSVRRTSLCVNMRLLPLEKSIIQFDQLGNLFVPVLVICRRSRPSRV